MLSRTSASRWHIVLLAAARLASVYAIGTALLLLPFYIVAGGPPQAVRDLKEPATLVVFALCLGFVLLAVARRAGLVALWLVLGGLWAWIVRESVVDHTDFAAVFVGWSALAVPLALVGGLGVPARLRVRLGRWKPSAIRVTAALWATLLLPTLTLFLLFNFGFYPLDEVVVAYRIAWEFARLSWVFGPPVIVALSIAHVWVGTAPAKLEPPAA